MATDDDTCPNGDNLQGEPIPEELRASGYYGDNPPTHYSQKIGVNMRGVYDGVLYWSCPACGICWPRFTDGGRLTELSKKYAREENERQARL